MWGERPIALARELTKLHEEVLRGTAREVRAALTAEKRRGEMVLVLGGRTRNGRRRGLDEPRSSAARAEDAPAPDRILRSSSGGLRHARLRRASRRWCRWLGAHRAARRTTSPSLGCLLSVVAGLAFFEGGFRWARGAAASAGICDILDGRARARARAASRGSARSSTRRSTASPRRPVLAGHRRLLPRPSAGAGPRSDAGLRRAAARSRARHLGAGVAGRGAGAGGLVSGLIHAGARRGARARMPASAGSSVPSGSWC